MHWGGDCFSTFEAMGESLRGGLSLAYSGFGYWSHDIGGFEGTPDPAVVKRWLAFGLLSSHSRLHGSSSYRVPWAFDDEAVDVTRLFTRLKLSLMPYLAGAARDAYEAGTPMARPMLLEFPEDPSTATIETQYMLGGSLLVAPVFTEDGTVTYYVPAAQAVGGPDTLFDVVRAGSRVRVTSASARPWRVQVGDRAVDGGPSGAVIDL